MNAHVSIATLKAKLSEYVARARRGEEIIVTDRGEPVARLAAITGVASTERVAALVRKGVLQPSRGKVPRDFLTRPLPHVAEDAAIKAILEEREQGW